MLANKSHLENCFDNDEMRICSLSARTSGMSDEELKADLEQEEAELEALKILVEEARKELAQAKTAFDLEEKKPENS